jgi:hypothetical protein
MSIVDILASGVLTAPHRCFAHTDLWLVPYQKHCEAIEVLFAFKAREV